MTAGTANMAEKWQLNPAQFWLRGERPPEAVAYDETTGIWNVYGHPELVEAFAHPAVFSSDTPRILSKDALPDFDDLLVGNLINMDPPDHTKLRKLVSKAFTAKVVADLEPRIAELTNEFLDAATAAGDRIELVDDLAYPLPVTVIAELLGVPASDRPLFRRLTEGMMTQQRQQFSLLKSDAEQEEGVRSALESTRRLVAYFHDHIADRRAAPRADLLTKLVEAEVDGHRLSDGEVATFALILLVAGHITTTFLLGNTVLCLDAYPDQMAAVQADRSLVPGAIEEALRFLSPFAALGRATMTETELGGTRIPADQMVMMWMAAANRDPRTFADPDVYDATRDPNPHMSFGRGIHFCVGAPLARLEGRVALNILLDRVPRLRTIPDDPPVFVPPPTMTGVNRLPLQV